MAGRVMVIVALAAAVAAGCGGDDQSGQSTTAGPFVPKTTADAGPPRTLNPRAQLGPPKELFTNNCASCHTLAAADAEGFVGPDLDEMRPSAARVVAAIDNGGARNEIMPSDILVPEDARRVARYIARVAGR